ncbi:MAG: hypothetical protein ACREJ6_13160 [Candidatus Methylomirabilis sp.]
MITETSGASPPVIMQRLTHGSPGPNVPELHLTNREMVHEEGAQFEGAAIGDH